MSLLSSTPPRVLVVEDEAPVCDLLSSLLREEGYDPLCALTDEAAYELIQQEWRSIAALVVDINLGRGTTGFDVARHARGLNPKVVVVYVTGGSARSTETHGVEGGVLVAKPFDRALLMDTLKEKLGLG